MGYAAGKIYENDDKINITGDVVFDVDAPAGHWFIFPRTVKVLQI